MLLPHRCINTDAQALAKSLVPNRLNIGNHITRGLGAGGVPAVGRKAAEESKEEIAKAVAGADLVSGFCQRFLPAVSVSCLHYRFTSSSALP